MATLTQNTDDIEMSYGLAPTPRSISKEEREKTIRLAIQKVEIEQASSAPEMFQSAAAEINSDISIKDSDEWSIPDLEKLQRYSKRLLSPSTFTQLKLATLGTIDDSIDAEDIETFSSPEPESEPENTSSQNDHKKLRQLSVINLADYTSENTSDSSDSEMSDNTDDTVHPKTPSKIRIPFPPKQRGKSPRTRATRTKIITFAIRTLNKKQRKIWEKYKRGYPTAQIERIGNTWVVSVITSCLTPEQQQRIKEEKEEAQKFEAHRIAKEKEHLQQIALFGYLQERQIADFRAGKRETGAIEWEEELKSWSQEDQDEHEEENCVDAEDLTIECLRVVEQRLYGVQWKLKKVVDKEDFMEDSFWGRMS